MGGEPYKCAKKGSDHSTTKERPCLVYSNSIPSKQIIGQIMELWQVGAHSSKLRQYTGNWAKSRGWALFCEWALFLKTTPVEGSTEGSSNK